MDKMECPDCYTKDYCQCLKRSLKRARKERRAKNREKVKITLSNGIKKYKLEDRSRYITETAIIIDEKYTYYGIKKTVKVKGNPKRYQMRGFQHFVEVFLK